MLKHHQLIKKTNQVNDQELKGIACALKGDRPVKMTSLIYHSPDEFKCRYREIKQSDKIQRRLLVCYLKM